METIPLTRRPSGKITYLFCTLTTPALLFLLYNYNTLVENLRTDEYSYGPVFYLVLAAVMFLFNALIVLITYRPSTLFEKVRVWFIGSLLSASAVIVAGLLFVIFIFLAFAFGDWNYG